MSAQVDVCYPQERDVARWTQRHAAGEVPGRWPYGLDRLQDDGTQVRWTGLTAPGRATTALHRASSALGRRAVPAGAASRIGLAWDENAAVRMTVAHPSPRMHAGAIWVTDAVARGRRDGATRARVRALRAMDGVWCLSRAQLEPLADLLGAGGPPVSFVRFGVDADFYRPQPYPDEPLVVSVGGDRDRDAATLYAALEQVRRAVPQARVVVQTTSDLAPPAGVERVRHVPHRALRDLYARASVVVVATRPNLHVSGMTVSLEAMATGRPVVVTGSPGMDDYVVDGEHGRVAPSGDAGALAEGVVDLLRDPARAAETGARGRRAVEDGLRDVHLAARLRTAIGLGPAGGDR